MHWTCLLIVNHLNVKPMRNLPFIALVANMREEQKAYFKAISRAKRTRHPDHFAEAYKHLELSKLAEQEVDHRIAEHQQKTAVA